MPFILNALEPFWIYPNLVDTSKSPMYMGIRRCSLVKEKRKSYNRQFKKEAVALITEKGYSIAEASRNLGIEYSVLRRWKIQLTEDPQVPFPGKGKRRPADEELHKLQKELERVKEERDILKKALAYFAEDQK